MKVNRFIPIHERKSSAASEYDTICPDNSLRKLLIGDQGHWQLPPLVDFAGGLADLCSLTRNKFLLPLAQDTTELACVRDGEKVIVNLYTTESLPEVHVWQRALPLDALVSLCIETLDYQAKQTGDKVQSRLFLRARQDLLNSSIRNSGDGLNMVRSSGSIATHGSACMSDLGYRVEVPHTDTNKVLLGSKSDVHALLFHGELWIHTPQKKKFAISRGPVMLTILRIIDAISKIADAEKAQRGAHLRIRTELGTIAFRLNKNGQLILHFKQKSGDELVFENLSLAQGCLPLLRLASEVVRVLARTDRTQSKNIRVTSVRRRTRELRRVIRTRSEVTSFENNKPERLRIGQRINEDMLPPVDSFAHSDVSRLRFAPRWSAQLDGLDAGSCFFCGDKLVLSNSSETVALDRTEGHVLWAFPSAGFNNWMVGNTLMQINAHGCLQLRDTHNGEVFVNNEIHPRQGGTMKAIYAGGAQIPPMAVVTEGHRKLTAIDLRSGQVRWKFTSPDGTDFQLKRSGRVLVVTAGANSVHAIDVTTGEVVWRYSHRGSFQHPVTIRGETVIAMTGGSNTTTGNLVALNLYSGKLLWQQSLYYGPNAPALTNGNLCLVATGAAHRRFLSAFELETGRALWAAADPGIAQGASSVIIDSTLIINAPSGEIVALSTDNGSLKWNHLLAHPIDDDIPRQLETILRGGALFVPSARVQILNPQTGEISAGAEVCDLVPDFLRVDERGWIYVAEESGLINALAPLPQLRLVKG